MTNYIFVTTKLGEMAIFVDHISTIRSDDRGDNNSIINLASGGSVFAKETMSEVLERISLLLPESYEPNNYTLCFDCGDTYHEDESHKCGPE